MYAWRTVETFIKGLGFICNDERVPVSSRRYQKAVGGLEVILNPCFVGERGKLTFTGLIGWVYRGDDFLFCFSWPPGKTLSQAMDEALQDDIGEARTDIEKATKRLEEVKSLYDLYTSSLADWGRALVYPRENNKKGGDPPGRIL